MRRSISKNTLDDDILRTSTLRQSQAEKEVFSPVDKADDGCFGCSRFIVEDTTKLRATINQSEEDSMNMLRASKVLANANLTESQAVIATEQEIEANLSDIEILAREYSPFAVVCLFKCRVYIIKCLPPYDTIKPMNDVPLLPPLASGSKPLTLVLDLDETLVHCSLTYMENCHYCYHVAVLAEFEFLDHCRWCQACRFCSCSSVYKPVSGVLLPVL